MVSIFTLKALFLKYVAQTCNVLRHEIMVNIVFILHKETLHFV